MPLCPYLSIAVAILTGSKRDLHKDSQILVRQMNPKPILANTGLIPEKGPFLVTLNHYSRPGFFILWAALAISSALPQTPLWLMTSAWTNRTGGLDHLRTTFSKALFKRLAGVYGLVTMPPMPPTTQEVAERALSIRKLMGKLHENTDTVLCLAPEGMDFPGGILGKPYPGTGKMILQISNHLKRILPVGVYEEEGKLVLNFGHPYLLQLPEKMENLDEWAINQVMGKIAAQLPEEMRGPYQLTMENNQ